MQHGVFWRPERPIGLQAGTARLNGDAQAATGRRKNLLPNGGRVAKVSTIQAIS